MPHLYGGSRFAAFIEQRSRAIIEDELNRHADWSPARSLKQMAGKIPHEYEGGFFIELIQNGHDAHPHGSIDGTLHITLDRTEGEYGCVYVANRGRPFSESNVKATRKLSIMMLGLFLRKLCRRQ